MPSAPAQGRVDDLKATCCPAAASPAAPLAGGIDTPEATDDSCSYECGSAFNEYVAELLTEEVLGGPTGPLGTPSSDPCNLFRYEQRRRKRARSSARTFGSAVRPTAAH